MLLKCVSSHCPFLTQRTREKASFLKGQGSRNLLEPACGAPTVGPGQGGLECPRRGTGRELSPPLKEDFVLKLIPHDPFWAMDKTVGRRVSSLRHSAHGTHGTHGAHGQH